MTDSFGRASAELTCRAAHLPSPALGELAEPVPLENRGPPGDPRAFIRSGGTRVLVDQAAQDRFPADPLVVEVGNNKTATAVFTVWDALSDALVRPGGVVVRLVLSQYDPQMRFTENQHTVQKLSPQCTDKALADRVHARHLDSSAQDPGAGGLEDGVERGGEVRSAIANQELNIPEPLAETEGEVPGLLHGPLPGGVRGDPAKMHPAAAVLDEHQDIQSPEEHGVHVQEIHCDDPGSLDAQELPPARARAARCRIDARCVQDLPHGGRRDCHAELQELAVDPAMA